jgi:hypothetical protein
MSVSPNRLVALLTPIVFAPLAGSISVLVAHYGLDIDTGKLQAIFIAGATIAFGKAALWLKGWQEHETRQAEPADAPVGAADEEPDLEAPAGHDDDAPDPDDLEPEPDDDHELQAVGATE